MNIYNMLQYILVTCYNIHLQIRLSHPYLFLVTNTNKYL